MMSAQLQVAVDVGSQRHRVAVGDAAGELLDEFDVEQAAHAERVHVANKIMDTLPKLD